MSRRNGLLFTLQLCRWTCPNIISKVQMILEQKLMDTNSHRVEWQSCSCRVKIRFYFGTLRIFVPSLSNSVLIEGFGMFFFHSTNVFFNHLNGWVVWASFFEIDGDVDSPAGNIAFQSKSFDVEASTRGCDHWTWKIKQRGMYSFNKTMGTNYKMNAFRKTC